MAVHREDRSRAAPPAIVGSLLVVLGAVALFATVVGYAWAPGDQGFWARLSDGDSFGLSSTVTLVIGSVALVVGLLLIGVGVGTAREHHNDEHHHPHPV
jgi:dipeptide/tripeptide permease